MNRRITLFFLIMTLIASAVEAQSKPRLVILPFSGGDNGEGETIAELFAFQPDIAVTFTVVPRTGTPRIQGEEFPGITDTDALAERGRRQNAVYVLAGSLRKAGTGYLICSTLTHTESLQIVAGDYRECMRIEDIQKLVPDISRKLVGASRNIITSPRLAVLPVSVPPNLDGTDAETLMGLLTIQIAGSGKFAVIPKTSTLNGIVTHQNLSQENLLSPSSMKVYGRVANTQYVLSASVRSLGTLNMFVASILSTDDGSQLSGNARNYSALDDGHKSMRDLALALTGVNVETQALPNNFVRIAGGTFLMGSPSMEVGRKENEAQHRVTVDSFYISKYEVTQKEYADIMGENPSNIKGPNLPVEQVTWFNAIQYCNARSVREGLKPAYTITADDDIIWDRESNGYRLPTEAEWEYACRAGTAGPFSAGNNITTREANYNGGYPYNNNPKGSFRRQTSEVGTFPSNPWGLHDMHGNVWEWCWDWYEVYGTATQTNPQGPSSGEYRIIRGGSWNYEAKQMRSANRSAINPFSFHDFLGFRLVRPQGKSI